MRYLATMTATALVALSLNSAAVQAHPCPYTPMIESWYHRYLHRAPDPGGLHTWVSTLRRGATPEDVQASILASEEYLCAHGHCDTGYISGLFTDVLGRTPCEPETREWTHRLQLLGCRKRLALEFLAVTTLAQSHRTARPLVAVPVTGHRHDNVPPLMPVVPASEYFRDARVVTPAAPAILPVPAPGVRLSGTYTRR